MTKGIKVENVMESARKTYIDKHTPIRFFRSQQDFLLDEKGIEYICYDVSFGTIWSNGWFFFDEPKALLCKLMPIDEWIERITYMKSESENTKYALYSIVNVANITEKIDFMIWHKILETEKEKERTLTKEENIAIVESYFNLPVLCRIKGEDSCYPVFAEKNAYRSINERMRFFFCINDCKHCKYWNDWCTNVVSDNYDCKAMKDECCDFVDIKVGD